MNYRTLILAAALTLPLSTYAHASQWFWLARGTPTAANPDTCEHRSRDGYPTSPAALHDLATRMVFYNVQIEEEGNDEVDVVVTKKSGDDPAYYRYFRTSEACEAAAKSEKDDEAAIDKYR
jgi:hypothetical protein